MYVCHVWMYSMSISPTRYSILITRWTHHPQHATFCFSIPVTTVWSLWKQCQKTRPGLYLGNPQSIELLITILTIKCVVKMSCWLVVWMPCLFFCLILPESTILWRGIYFFLTYWFHFYPCTCVPWHSHWCELQCIGIIIPPHAPRAQTEQAAQGQACAEHRHDKPGVNQPVGGGGQR